MGSEKSRKSIAYYLNGPLRFVMDGLFNKTKQFQQRHILGTDLNKFESLNISR